MITVHALNFSRATRVIWLLEDLKQSCTQIEYLRTEAILAPPELAQIHPLGKSPVIEDDGIVVSESATILRYITEKYGDYSHQPPRGTPAFWRHEVLLDYVEASLAEVALAVILPAARGKAAPDPAQAALNKHLNYMTAELSTGPLLCGADVMLADIQISYILALLARFDLLESHPVLLTYWAALQTQPGYIAAIEKTGPMAPPR